MDDRTKCEIYTTLLNSLNENGELKKEISKSTYKNQLKLIKNDLLSKVISDQETALQMLKILMENNVQDIHKDLLTILSNDNIDENLKNSILSSLTFILKDFLQSNNIDNLVVLYTTWKNYNLQKFYEVFESACTQETEEDCQLKPIYFANLLIDHFLPNMSSPNKADILEPLIELASKISEMYPVTSLDDEEFLQFLKKVPRFLATLVNLQQLNQNVWREPLHFLTKYLDEKLYEPEVQEIFNKSSINWSLVQSELENNISIELIKYISENNLVIVARLFNDWRNINSQKFTAALREICQNSDYIPICKGFFFKKLLPMIMAIKGISEPLKVICIDLALEFASALPITELNAEEYSRFLDSVNGYIKNISDLKDMNFEQWHKLWIFLVRFFGKKLHHSMSLINRLLRVVEHAFRNSSYEQRLRGYDCWKELIDNVSLDSHHIGSEKQIKLLLTPLRAKFSKQEAVIIKRFEVFVYLIEKLQNRAVLVLKEFLEFCFGEVGEDTDPNKAGQGKSLSELWLKSSKVLLALLGHSHDLEDQCLETTTELYVKSPVLNSNNISNHYYYVINSVAEACSLLKDVELNQQKDIVLTCFWTSLLHMILNDSVVKKDQCIRTIGTVLDKQLRDGEPYCNNIASIIFKCTIKLDWTRTQTLVLKNLDHFSKIMFSVPLDKESYADIEKFQVMLCTLETREDALTVTHHMFDCFGKYKTVESNADIVAQFWIFLVNELDELAKNKCLNFLVWPALHMHHITHSSKEALIREHYKHIVSKYVEKCEELQLALFKNFEKLVKNNPLVFPNILTLITMFNPNTENKEIANVTLEILEMTDVMSIVPATDTGSIHIKNLEQYLKKFYESNINNIQDIDTIKKLCMCLQHVLKFRQYDILLTVESSLKSLPDNLKWMHGKFLSLDFLMDLFEKETDVHSSEKIHRLIEIFRSLKNPDSKKDLTPFMRPGGRSAKIAKLVKQIPSSPVKRPQSPSTLRLFGKDIDTRSPLKVKGSQLKDSKDTPTKTLTPTRNTKKTDNIDDESNSKFILIESEVKLDKSKLTKHQKESLSKRREDIPALYQDLSQSNTQCLDSNSNSTNTKFEEIKDIFKKPCVEDKNKSREMELKDIENTKIQNDIHHKINEDTKGLDDAKGENKWLTNKIDEPVTKSDSKPKKEMIQIDNSKNTSKETKIHNSKIDKKESKKAAVEAELRKLSMNIVGAEQFISTTTKRQRREKKLDQEEKKGMSKNKQNKNKKSDPISKDVSGNENAKFIQTEETVQEKKKGWNLKKISICNTENKEDLIEIAKKDVLTNKPETPTIKCDPEIIVEKTPSSGKKRGRTVSAKRKKPNISGKQDQTPLKEAAVSVIISAQQDGDSIDNSETLKYDLPKNAEELLLLAEINKDTKIHKEVNIDEREPSFGKLPISSSAELSTHQIVTKENTESMEKMRFAIDNDETFKDVKLTNNIQGELFERIIDTKKPCVISDPIENNSKEENIEKHTIELQPEISIKNKNGTEDTSCKNDKIPPLNKSNPVSSENDDDKTQTKKRKGRPVRQVKRLPKNASSDGKCDESRQNVYEFEAEEKETDRINIKSPNSGNNPVYMPKLNSPLPLKVTLTTKAMATKEQKKRLKNCVGLNSPGNGGASPGSRKSKRKSIPTEKMTQSELFKVTESTPKMSTKKLNSKKLELDKNDLLKEKNTDSDLFSPSEIENKISEEAEPTKNPSNLTANGKPSKRNEEGRLPLSEQDKPSPILLKSVVKNTPTNPVKQLDDLDKSSQIMHLVNSERLKLEENFSKKGIKRRRSSSDDDDDIIESSQDSNVSNVSASILRRSVSRRLSIDKPLTSNIKDNTATDDSQPVVEQNKVNQINLIGDKTVRNITNVERKTRRGKRIKCPSKNVSSNERPEVKDCSQKSLNDSQSCANKNKDFVCINSNLSDPIEKKRRGRSSKSPTTSDITFEGDSLKNDKELNKSETFSDNDMTTIELTDSKKQRKSRSPKSPTNYNLKNDSISKSKQGDTTPEEARNKRRKPRKSPGKSDECLNFTELEKDQNTGFNASQSLVSFKSSSNTEELVESITNDELSRPVRLKRKFEEKHEIIPGQQITVESTAQSLVSLESSSNNEELSKSMANEEIIRPVRLKRKCEEKYEIIPGQQITIDSTNKEDFTRKLRQQNVKETNLITIIDNDALIDSTVHILEAVEKACDVTVSPKRKGRKSPIKPEKESNQIIDDIMQKVKKQVFPDKFTEPTDLDISTQSYKQRTQSQDTQTQDTESMDINDDIQLHLDLPQKPLLNETDKDIAKMDTASFPLVDSEDLKGFDTSGNDNTCVKNSITNLVDTLTEDPLKSCMDESEVNSQSCIDPDSPIKEVDVSTYDTVKHLPVSESIVSSSEDIRTETELVSTTEVDGTENVVNEVSVETDVLAEVPYEVPETEELATETLESINIQKIVENSLSENMTQNDKNCNGIPSPSETSLPSSPVTGDTPNRTSELLNCTSDISPIGSKSSSDKSSSDDEFVEQRKLIPVALKFDNEDVDHEANKEKSPEKADDAPSKIDAMSPDKAEKEVDKASSSFPSNDEARTSRDVKTIVERSNKFFDMVKCGSPTTFRLFNKRKSGHNMSPSASRIKKLMSNVKVPSENEITDNVSQEDILTFTREVPSPLAVPRSSILKRKHSEINDEGISPCPKRKRVNFSDPCTTSKKVFIKEDNATSQSIYGANSDDDLDRQFLEVLAANNIIDTPQSDSNSIETEESLQVTNPFLLKDGVPIYPELVDCEENVSVISRKLTSPMFVNTLLSKLNAKNIKTIGDLARQSEVSIARLPFKTPMVGNVHKALDHYYHKNFKSKGIRDRNETKTNNDQETNKEMINPQSRLEVALVKSDVKDDLVAVLGRAKSQGTSPETLCSLLLSVVDPTEVVNYVKTHSNLDAKDFLAAEDFPKITKHIIRTVGIPKMFEFLTESIESPEDESVYFDCMIKKSIDKQNLSSVIEKRSLLELQAALWENVDKQTYTKQALLQTCFSPFVNSTDLVPFFNKLNVVQIGDIVLSRVKTEESVEFIRRVLEKCSSHPDVKAEILSHCTVSDMADTIIRKGSPEEIVLSIQCLLSACKESKEDLIHIFGLISDSLVGVLPPTKLMELSIEFQRKIPIKD